MKIFNIIRDQYGPVIDKNLKELHEACELPSPLERILEKVSPSVQSALSEISWFFAGFFTGKIFARYFPIDDALSPSEKRRCVLLSSSPILAYPTSELNSLALPFFATGFFSAVASSLNTTLTLTPRKITKPASPKHAASTPVNPITPQPSKESASSAPFSIVRSQENTLDAVKPNDEPPLNIPSNSIPQNQSTVAAPSSLEPNPDTHALNEQTPSPQNINNTVTLNLVSSAGEESVGEPTVNVPVNALNPTEPPNHDQSSTTSGTTIPQNPPSLSNDPVVTLDTQNPPILQIDVDSSHDVSRNFSPHSGDSTPSVPASPVAVELPKESPDSERARTHSAPIIGWKLASSSADSNNNEIKSPRSAPAVLTAIPSTDSVLLEGTNPTLMSNPKVALLIKTHLSRPPSAITRTPSPEALATPAEQQPEQTTNNVVASSANSTNKEIKSPRFTPVALTATPSTFHIRSPESVPALLQGTNPRLMSNPKVAKLIETHLSRPSSAITRTPSPEALATSAEQQPEQTTNNVMVSSADSTNKEIKSPLPRTPSPETSAAQNQEKTTNTVMASPSIPSKAKRDQEKTQEIIDNGLMNNQLTPTPLTGLTPENFQNIRKHLFVTPNGKAWNISPKDLENSPLRNTDPSSKGISSNIPFMSPAKRTTT